MKKSFLFFYFFIFVLSLLIGYIKCDIVVFENIGIEDRTPKLDGGDIHNKYPVSTSSNTCSFTFYYYAACLQGSTIPTLAVSSGVNKAIPFQNQTSAIYKIDYSMIVTSGSISSSKSLDFTFDGCGNTDSVSFPITIRCYEFQLSSLTFSSSQITTSSYFRDHTILKIKGLRYPITQIDFPTYKSFYTLSKDTFVIPVDNCNFKNDYSSDNIVTNSCNYTIVFYDSQKTFTISPGDYIDSINSISDIITYPDFNKINTYNQINQNYYSAITFKIKSSVYYPFKVVASKSLALSPAVNYFPIYGDSNGITYLYSFKEASSTSREWSLYYQSGSTALQATSFSFNQIDYSPIYNKFTPSASQVSSNLYLFTSTLTNTSFELAPVYYSIDSILIKGFPYHFPFGLKSGLLNYFQYEANFLCSNIYKRNIGVGQNQKTVSVFTLDRSGIVDTTPPTITNAQIIDIGSFYIILRIAASDLSGIASIRLFEDSSTGFNAEAILESGSLTDGIFQLIVSPLTTGQSIDMVYVVDKYGNSATLEKDSFYSVTSNAYQSTQTNLNFLTLLNSVTFDYYEMDVSNGPAYNTIYFNFSEPINYSFYVLFLKNLEVSPNNNKDYILGEPSNNNTLFTFKFSLMQNYMPGPLEFIFSYSASLPIPSSALSSKSPQQVIVKSLTPDLSGPFVTNIVKIPDSGIADLNIDPLQAVGWNITIEDKVNGFSHGFIVAQGLVDGSIYNFTLNSNNSEKSITFTLLLSNMSCLNQNYQIIQVKLYDTNNIYSLYHLNNIPVDGLLNPINPLLNYLGDQDALVLQVSCIPTNGDTSGPELISITPNRTSIDVGSNDRSISFTLIVRDSDSGINIGQSPIVYINSLFFNYVECKSKLISCDNSDEKQCTFKCDIELPFAFGFPNQLIYQVYGIWNKNGLFSGYSYNRITTLALGYIQTTFSTNIPFVQYTSNINSDGGNLLIIGRSISNSEKVYINYLNGTEVSVIPTCNSQLHCNIQVGGSALSFTIQIELKNKLLSNIYKIEPLYIGGNIDSSSSQDGGIVGSSNGASSLSSSFNSISSSSSSSSSTEITCPGQPVCGGTSNGYCTPKGCICISPWYGIECKQKIIIVPQPSFNNTDPNITIILPNENNNNQIEFTSLTSIIALRELDINNKVNQTHTFSKWYNNQINSTLNEYYSNFSNINNSDKTTQIKVTIQWFNNQTNITFADNELIMNPSSIKYTIEIKDYPFKSKLNSLEIVMSALFKSDKINSCSNKEFGESNGYEDSNYLKLQINDHSLYARFIKRGIIDNNKIVSVSNRLLDSSFSTIHEASTTQSYIGISIQHFENIAIVDPDFSIMLDFSKSSNSICKSTKLTSTQIAGIIIGCFGFAVVIAISFIVYYIKKKRNAREMSNLSNKLKNLS